MASFGWVVAQAAERLRRHEVFDPTFALSRAQIRWDRGDEGDDEEHARNSCDRLRIHLRSLLRGEGNASFKSDMRQSVNSTGGWADPTTRGSSGTPSRNRDARERSQGCHAGEIVSTVEEDPFPCPLSRNLSFVRERRQGKRRTARCRSGARMMGRRSPLTEAAWTLAVWLDHRESVCWKHRDRSE
jgi:hypothetical protein